MLSSKMCNLEISPWCDASQNAQCTIGSWTRATWRVSKSNVSSLRSIFVDWSPRIDDRLRYFANKGSVSSQFYNPDWMKHLKSLDNEHTSCLWAPTVLINFPQMQKSFPSVFSQRVCPVALRMHRKSVQNTCKAKKDDTRPTIKAKFGCFL